MNHTRNKQQQQQQQRKPPKESILSETSFGIQSIDDENSNNNIIESGLFSLHTLAQTQPDVTSFGRKGCDSNADLVIPKIKNTKVIQPSFGCFRVIVCGDSGIGKSLVVQALLSDHQQQQQSNEMNSDTVIEEYFDKDFCVVDTLGYGAFLHADTVISKVQAYIEKQFEHTNSLLNPNHPDDDRLLSLITHASNNSNLFSHVDICLYLTTGRLKNVDIEYMRNIHDLVNIVPVIVQPDTNSTMMIRPEQMMEKRIQILKTLQTHDIHFLDFGMGIDELIHHKSVDLPPFVLSWSTRTQMIYLSNLKYALFQNQRHVKHLRQATTLKFMQWRRQQQQQQAASFSSSSNDSSDTVSRMQRLHSVSEHRQMIEKEIIRREKKIRTELEKERNEKTVQLVLKEYQKQNRKDVLVYVIVGVLLGVILTQGSVWLFQT